MYAKSSKHFRTIKMKKKKWYEYNLYDTRKYTRKKKIISFATYYASIC